MERKSPLRKIYETIDNGEPLDKYKTMPDFPKIIELELTNTCNYQCRMCKTGTGSSHRVRGMMSRDIYQKLLSEVGNKKLCLKFVGWGEPTLHVNLIEFIEMAKKQDIVCHLTTNGSKMTDQYIDNILNSGLDSIKFSFQGVDGKGYKLVRRNEEFDALMDRIERLFLLRGNRLTPFVTIGTSVLNETKEQIELFKERAAKICDKVEVGTTSLQFVDIDKIEEPNVRKLFGSIKNDQSTFLRRYHCCHQVFDVITVHWNGDICACCFDADDDMVLGNLSKNSLKECWNSEKEELYRKILVQRHYEDLPLCKTCYDMYGWTYGDQI